MKYIEFLCDNNIGTIRTPHINKKNIFEYKSKVAVFDFYELKRLICFFSSIEKRMGNLKLLKYNIEYLNEIQFADKLTYILLECFLYNQIVIKKKKIEFFMRNVKNTIFTEGFRDSCIKLVGLEDRFDMKFKYTLTRYHYRKLIKYDDYMGRPDLISFVMADLTQFLKVCGLFEKHASSVAEISVELIDNALDHANSDCLLDIDVSQQPYFQKDNENQEFFAVNIAVLNFSKNILGEDICKIIDSNNMYNEHYKKLKLAENIHKEYFNNTYTRNHFYMMAAFQNKISGRGGSGVTGGRGLTKLIEELQESSVSDICYVVSNDTCLFFLKNEIKQDEEKWVGFNVYNNYKLPPSNSSLKRSPLNIIGTAYNLTFVFKKGEIL